MNHHFRMGDFSQNEWVKLNTNYPYIDIIIDKLYKYSGMLDNLNVNIAITIYKQLLNDGISPRSAIKYWDNHLLLNLKNAKNINYHRYFQIYMENINYYIKKK